jgi:predicted amino acid-binding ACT domain protein
MSGTRAGTLSPSIGAENRATVAAGFVRGLLSGLAPRRAEEVLGAAGLGREHLGDPVRTPIAAYTALYNAVVRELSDEELREPEAEENSFILSVYGADRPGIVSGVTRALADRSINITDVQTKSTGRESKIFVMILEVTAPRGVSSADVQRELKEIGTQLSVDVPAPRTP